MSKKSSWSFINFIKNLDAYPKIVGLEEFQTRTFSGAAVTVAAFVLMGILFLSEFYDYLSPKVTEDLFVDTSRSSKIKINMDIIFPSIPCDLISLDANDVSGAHHTNIQHNFYKRRLDLEGKPLQDPERQTSIGHGNKTLADMIAKNVSTTTVAECGSCYGSEHEKRKCCKTCDDILAGYREKGWHLPSLSSFEQCKREGRDTESQELPKEGCQLYGYLEVNRVAGNFHFAPGLSSDISHLHVHDLKQYSSSDFDLSHRIRHLSFGTNVHGKTNPIDGLEHKTEKGTRCISYYMKIIPTMFERKDGAKLVTNQFSVTQHDKKFSMHMMGGSGGLPGVYFHYELSPLMVKYTEESKSLGHFLTGLCAIIGGIYTVASLLDAAIFHSVQVFQQKVEIGKAG